MPFITVRYSCPACGIRKREVEVQARESEDVIEWMEKVCIIALGNDHASVSPHCHPEELKDVMIPIHGSDKIGGVIHQ
jgi:hypothetical protein